MASPVITPDIFSLVNLRVPSVPSKVEDCQLRVTVAGQDYDTVINETEQGYKVSRFRNHLGLGVGVNKDKLLEG